MSEDTIISYVQSGLFTIIIVAGPPLMVGLIVGVLVSIFQTVTSIQEPTLAFVPKILAVLVGIIVFGSFMLSNLTEFTRNIILSFPELITPR